jgi:hypothetical protein
VIDETTMSMVGAGFTVGLAILLVGMPRRAAVLPLIASACFITLAQQVVVGGQHFTALRVIILVGWIRLVVRGELYLIARLNVIDKTIICYALVSFVRLFQPKASLSAQLGFVFNLIGIYFLVRFLVKDCADVERAIKVLGLCLIPLAALMTVEMFTGRNVFSIFGGVPEIALVRDGKFRCQGSFRHPILAGTVGAVSMPLLVGLLAKQANRKLWLLTGIGATVAICAASQSSGPAIAFCCGLIGLLGWRWRRRMRLIGWSLLISLFLLHAVMKAPVWYLMARVSNIVGGGGWHRSFLVDQALAHLNEWWLIGTSYTADWMPYALELYPDLADITNQFIAEGVSGGLLRMVIFIWIIVVCFRTVGRCVRTMENSGDSSAFLVWSLGASLVAHVASFLSVSYFDQIVVIWYMLWALIATVTASPSPSREPGCADMKPAVCYVENQGR